MTGSGLPPLIPRSVLFADPEWDAPRLSPDGTRITYLAPVAGKMAVWVRTVGQADDRVVAQDAVRPIPWARWQGDGRHILYLQDSGGDENYHLWRVDVQGGEALDLTPGTKVRALPLAIDDRFPDAGLVTLNARNPSLMDVHRLRFAAGESTLDTENPGDVLVWLADHQLRVRAAVAQVAGDFVIRVRDEAGAAWRVLDEIGYLDGMPRLVAFSADDRMLYAITAKDANTHRLVQYEVASGAVSTLYEDAKYDVEKVFLEPDTKAIGAVAVLRERSVWTALTARSEALLQSLGELGAGEFSILGGTQDGSALVVQCRSDAVPESYYVYSAATRSAELLFASRPKLLGQTLAAMQPVRFAARDGLSLSGYLTLPVGLEPRGLPTVLVVHGGPWYRDRWGFDPFVQWLANRGYAVLQVNFRGSTGYGKAFLNAGNREWAGAMRTDLLDARDWAIAEGYADAGRFAIFGGSYGGYAVLTALAWTPEAFRCGVDIVGPSDLTTFMASIPAYWEPMRKLLEQRVGDDEAFLKAQSPLYRASAISAPLLIAQGANDPRVKQQESDQMVQALRERGTEVEYLVFENEGHGLAHQENVQRFVCVTEEFLARHLGGRAEG